MEELYSTFSYEAQPDYCSVCEILFEDGDDYHYLHNDGDPLCDDCLNEILDDEDEDEEEEDE